MKFRKFQDSVFFEGSEIKINNLKCKIISFDDDSLNVIPIDNDCVDMIIKQHIIQRTLEKVGVK